ncbi:uncharacterized protein LOC124270373 [Haliotis rubra]|uniref:uncharacterized protein LOC124270373 n=1 Tax=Haliotis rubra TaxID=36100 RepID=UPI001EE588DC|nr:uncharacterized protein LOC124270373 [Haliotis rubra]
MEVAACLSVREALVEQGVTGIYTKWPNDLWLRGHKLCGVMVEPYEMDSSLYVLGIGLNLNADCRRDPDLCSIATSVRCERHGVGLSRETTLAYLCNRLEKNLTKTQSDLRQMFYSITCISHPMVSWFNRMGNCRMEFSRKYLKTGTLKSVIEMVTQSVEQVDNCQSGRRHLRQYMCAREGDWSVQVLEGSTRLWYLLLT